MCTTWCRTPAAPAAAEIAHEDVIDLTGKMDSDGTLHWEVPPGNWTILRMGYSLTGAKNRPSVPAGSGLRSRQAEPKYVQQYFSGLHGSDAAAPRRPARGRRCTT